jgi:hypothetical protein
LEKREYFRRDRNEGVTPPDLTKNCTIAEHVVRARGKKTNFTSVTLDLSRVRDFGETSYQLKRPETEADGHEVIEHDVVIQTLQEVCRNNQKDERARALQAIRYASAHLEGLVRWDFDISRVPRKEVINWVYGRIQQYFRKL